MQEAPAPPALQSPPEEAQLQEAAGCAIQQGDIQEKRLSDHQQRSRGQEGTGPVNHSMPGIALHISKSLGVHNSTRNVRAGFVASCFETHLLRRALATYTRMGGNTWVARVRGAVEDLGVAIVCKSEGDDGWSLGVFEASGEKDWFPKLGLVVRVAKAVFRDHSPLQHVQLERSQAVGARHCLGSVS